MFRKLLRFVFILLLLNTFSAYSLPLFYYPPSYLKELVKQAMREVKAEKFAFSKEGLKAFSRDVLKEIVKENILKVLVVPALLYSVYWGFYKYEFYSQIKAAKELFEKSVNIEHELSPAQQKLVDEVGNTKDPILFAGLHGATKSFLMHRIAQKAKDEHEAMVLEVPAKFKGLDEERHFENILRHAKTEAIRRKTQSYVLFDEFLNSSIIAAKTRSEEVKILFGDNRNLWNILLRYLDDADYKQHVRIFAAITTRQKSPEDPVFKGLPDEETFKGLGEGFDDLYRPGRMTLVTIQKPHAKKGDIQYQIHKKRISFGED